MLKNDDYEGYKEALESQKQEEDKLTITEKQFNNMQSMLEKLIAGLPKTSDQQPLS
jgi:CRISPR/Cas system-associated protein endoribonuclease Cas2